MHRCLSFVCHSSRFSAASSLPSLLAPKHSVRSYGGLEALRSYGSLGSPCSSKCFSGLPQNRGDTLVRVSQSFETAEHVRRFSSMNSGWNNINEKVNTSRGFNPDSQRNINPISMNSGWNNMKENVNPSHGFNPDSQRNINPMSQNDGETKKSSTAMDFVRGIIDTDGRDVMGAAQLSRYNLEHDADFVHIKLLRNNTFVTVTDSKGNIKLNASAGCLKELKGGQKLSQYAAEATAEEVGRRARRLGLKSVVMKVKGFTYFKKKRQAIVSWNEGFTNSRMDRNPIVYIEDATRRPHNGCRLPKRRRI